MFIFDILENRFFLRGTSITPIARVKKNDDDLFYIKFLGEHFIINLFSR